MNGFRDLSRNRDFTTLWVGGMVSELGTRMSMFVLPLLTYSISGSVMIAAFVEGAYLVGLVGLLLPGGALVDRLDRRVVMMAASGSGLILYGSLAVAGAMGHLTIAHLAVVGFLAGAGAGIFEPAEMSSIRAVVTQKELPTALSQNQARQHVAALVGAPVGGLLYAIARWMPFAVDAVTFGVSFIMLSRIRSDLSARPVEGARPRIRADIVEGLRFVAANRFFRVLMIWSALANLTLNAVFFTVFLRMMNEGFHPSQIGFVEAAAGLAGILGAIAAPTIIDRTRTGVLTVVIAWGLAIPVVPLIFWANPLVAGASLFVILLLNPAGNAGIGSYRMAVTPDHLQGRVAAASQFVSLSVMPLAPLAGGVLLEHFGGPMATLVLAIATAGVAMIVTLSGAVRSVPKPSDWARAEGTVSLAA